MLIKNVSKGTIKSDGKYRDIGEEFNAPDDAAQELIDLEVAEAVKGKATKKQEDPPKDPPKEASKPAKKTSKKKVSAKGKK